MAIHSLPIDVGGGYDRLIVNGLWLLVLGNGTATLSVDCYVRERTWSSRATVYTYARVLGVYQLVVLYVITGIGKSGRAWYAPYDAVYRALNRTPYLRWENGWVGDIYLFTQVGTVVAWWWETTFFVVGLWFLAKMTWLGERAQGWADRLDLRIPYLGIGLFTHVLLFAVLDLGTFTAVTFAFYLLLYSPAEWRTALGRAPAG